MIFFCWATLEKSVYVLGGGGGFTSYVNKFVEAETDSDAANAYQEYLEKKGIRVRKVTARIALMQDKRTYVFPEHILCSQARSTEPPVVTTEVTRRISDGPIAMN